MESMVVNPKFWSGKRVFLTGHTGFKGSWLSLWLQQLGAKVTGYALMPPTQPSLFEQARVHDGMTSCLGDIRDAQKFIAAMLECAPEIVIHMAAQPLVRESYIDPIETYSTNVMGTVHMFEAVRQTPSVRAVVNVTTDKCYENREDDRAYREVDAMGGRDPYSNSKGCAELVSSAYRQSFFDAEIARRSDGSPRVAMATARAGNVIGGGDWATDRLIPDIIRAFEVGLPVLIRNPHATRPWQHVLEPLRGYLTLAEKLFEFGCVHSGSFNFGPHLSDAKPVQWIVERMVDRWGGQARWQLDGGLHPHEAHFLKLDIQKAAKQLDWLPVLRLDAALDMSVSWARQRLDGEDVRQITLKQIQDYQLTAS
jgi:CDP-glucose 4,6-dehydratase